MSHTTTTTILLLFLVTTTISDTTATVLDVDNQPVLPNTTYFIVPFKRGLGGGLIMQPINNTMHCPLYVAQAMQQVDRGLPVKLLPANPNTKLISSTTDVNVVFDGTSTCDGQTTGWQLLSDRIVGINYVATGGEIGNPGAYTERNWFKFEKVGRGKYEYKIEFCPRVCKFCKVLCGPLGVYIDKDGKRWLSISGQPLLVMLKKA